MVAIADKIQHKCEAERIQGGLHCDLCGITTTSSLDMRKKCKGWKFKEEIIENKFVAYVQHDGNASYKFEATKGDPDQIVLIAPNYFFFIEFKRKGHQPTPLQIHKHKLLRSKGYAVYTTSSYQEACAIYTKEKNKAAQISKEGS